MTTLQIKSAWPKIKDTMLCLAIIFAPFFLIYLGRETQELDPSMGLLDAGVWQLLFLGIISFLGFSALAWWLLQQAWLSLGLPKIEQMVLQFKQLTLWQQFALYWASFALLLLAGVLSLTAVF